MPTPERRIGDVILSLEHISLAFGGVKALSDITFDVREHEVRAIIGPLARAGVVQPSPSPPDVVAGVNSDPDAPPTPADALATTPAALTVTPAAAPSPAGALPAVPAAPAPTVPGPTALGPGVAKPGSLDALVALMVTPAAAAAPAAPIPAGAKPATRVQLAKAGPAPTPGALDALIAQIADTR